MRQWPGDTIRIPWNSLKNPMNVTEEPSIVTLVPSDWNVRDGVNYFYGTSLSDLINGRCTGVIPSTMLPGAPLPSQPTQAKFEITSVRKLNETYIPGRVRVFGQTCVCKITENMVL